MGKRGMTYAWELEFGYFNMSELIRSVMWYSKEPIPKRKPLS